MRAAVVGQAGAVPSAGDFPAPGAMAGRPLLELVGSAVHPLVRALTAGSHYGSDRVYPSVPGVDAVARDASGRLVYTAMSRAPWGTMAELLATPFDLPIPDGVDPFAVAAGVNPALSAWMPLTARLEEVGHLSTVLVLGATGLAGSMAVEAAQSFGANRVLAAGLSGDALAHLRDLGAETVAIARADRDATTTALEHALGGDLPTLVLDYVWGSTAEAAFEVLQGRGLDEHDAEDISYVEIGTLGGAHARLPAALLRSRRLRITGSGAGSLSMARLAAQVPRIIAAIGDGTLHAPYTTFPLSRVAEAWQHAGSARPVLVPDR